MKKSLILFSVLSFSGLAHSNEIYLKSNQPMDITYQIAHKNPGGETVLGRVETAHVDGYAQIPVELDGFVLGGIVPLAINGKDLPKFQFDQANQCSMATDKTHPSGALVFALNEHNIKCATHGGVIR